MSEQLDPCGLTYDECASLAKTYGVRNQAVISLIVANADRLRANRALKSPDWQAYHSALSQCAELLDNMADEAPLVEVPSYLAAKLATPANTEAVANVLTNAELIPDPRMEGMTDCYAVPIDDIDALRATPAAAAPQQAVPEGYVLMPKRLTAENGAKSLFMGEFKEQITVECPECNGDAECHVCGGEGSIQQDIYVEWDTIKRIYALAVMNFAAPVAAIEQPREVQPWENRLRLCPREGDVCAAMQSEIDELRAALRTQPPADSQHKG